MSLDVYLEDESDMFFSANITHNLGRMAAQIPMLYEALWRGQWMSDLEALQVAEDADKEQRYADGDAIRAKIPPTEARMLIPHLQAGLVELQARPAHYKTFEAENGWGRYERFIPWIERYLAACCAHPSAIVRISR